MSDLKVIPGFEGYSISAETGLIWSHKTERWLIMKSNHPHGYGRTKLYNHGKEKWVFNHIKQVEVHGDSLGNHFPENIITLRSIGKSIDHINGDKMDPRQCNLELMMHSDNVQRYYDNKKSQEFDIPDLI